MGDEIHVDRLVQVSTVDDRYQSYNVEMAEVTGAKFWRPYTAAQVRGDEPFGRATRGEGLSGHAAAASLDMNVLTAPRDPVDLSGTRVRTLARALGPVYVRVSGSWASNTYFDVDDSTGGTAPDGYVGLLTTAQWDGVIDFVRHVGGELVTSMANTPGAHHPDGSWNPANSRAFLEYTITRGLRIAGAEFMNEPDLPNSHGAPKGYSAGDYVRDSLIFEAMFREVVPDGRVIGPGAVLSRNPNMMLAEFPHLAIDDLMASPANPPDVFSYHFYCGLSERGGGLHHTPADQVLTEDYLARTGRAFLDFAAVRDDHVPGAPIWVTETADAALGGSSWSPTWLDVPRYVDQLGRLARLGVECVMHNTLCASDYGLLDTSTHEPRAKYWAAWLWARFMGTRVYDPGLPIREGLHAYVHSRRDAPGFAAAIVNNSRTQITELGIPDGSTAYVLTGPELRGTSVHCNGKLLRMIDDATMPDIEGTSVAGSIGLPPVSVTFLTFP